ETGHTETDRNVKLKTSYFEKQNFADNHASQCACEQIKSDDGHNSCANCNSSNGVGASSAASGMSRAKARRQVVCIFMIKPTLLDCSLLVETEFDEAFRLWIEYRHRYSFQNKTAACSITASPHFEQPEGEDDRTERADNRGCDDRGVGLDRRDPISVRSSGR